MAVPAVETKTLEFSTLIDAPVEQIWSMLTNRDDICDWLCYDAHVRVTEEGGFGVFIWREGNHAYVVYETVEENQKLAMSWRDGSDQQTRLSFKFDQSDEGVTLSTVHEGFTDAERAAHYDTFWTDHLRNLKSLLETGENLTITERVILGVLLSLAEEDAEERGMRVSRVVEGYSAEKAGIQAGDVIFEVEGKEVTQSSDISNTVADLKPGDVVQVKYMRDGEVHEVAVELKGYPVPLVPASFAEMANDYRAEHERINAALTEALLGVDDSNAAFKPAEDEQSILETIAQMIVQQRHTFEWLSTYANGPRRINPYYNDDERVQALVATYPTAGALVQALKDTQRETVAMIELLNTEMEKRKHYLWWMTFETAFSEEQAMALVRRIERRKEQAAA